MVKLHDDDYDNSNNNNDLPLGRYVVVFINFKSWVYRILVGPNSISLENTSPGPLNLSGCWITEFSIQKPTKKRQRKRLLQN